MKTSYYELHIGIKDKDNKDHLTLNRVKSELEAYFKSRMVDFSLTTQLGGYVTESGDYVLEDSVKIIFIGALSEDRLLAFVEGIKKIYNQESILYIRREIEQEYVGE